MSTQLTTQNKQVDIVVEQKPMTVTDIRRQIATIQTVMKEVMKEGTHYGVIPGTDAKSLWKPGAEKVAATFRLAPDYFVEDLSSDDVARYRVTCRLTSPTGVFVGSGLGEASTNEQKYKWRGAVCQEEYDATDDSRRRQKYGRKRDGGHYVQIQVRQEAADLANTVLKMAAKRALVAAILTATAASDIFAQDLEDMPPEVLDEIMGAEGASSTRHGNRSAGKPASKKPVQQPRAKSDKNATDKATEAAEAAGLVRPNQASQIANKCESRGVDPAKLMEAFGITTMEQLPASKFRDALSWIDGEAE